MQKAIARVPGHRRILQMLIAAVALIALAACTTTPSPRAETNSADAESSSSATAETKARETSDPDPAPLQVNEKPPDQVAPQPEPPAAGKPVPVATEPAVGSGETRTPQAQTQQVSPEPEPASSAAPALPDVSLGGRIVLDISQVDDVDADSVRDTVIYFRPAGAPMTATPRNFEITTRRKRLIPDVLVVPVGSTVSFPNEDDILHNVFSVSTAANFDLGFYGEGESKSHTFLEPGLAVIHCNVHHAMRADVLVVDTPFYAQPDRDGRFSIDGIEATAGELVAWHPRAGFLRRQVSVPTAESLDLELTLVRPRIPDHLDKTGQPYRPARPSRR